MLPCSSAPLSLASFLDGRRLISRREHLEHPFKPGHAFAQVAHIPVDANNVPLDAPQEAKLGDNDAYGAQQLNAHQIPHFAACRMNLAIVPHPVKWLLATESPAAAAVESGAPGMGAVRPVCCRFHTARDRGHQGLKVA